MIDQLAPSPAMGFFGMPRSGKTYACNEVHRRLETSVFVMDPKEQKTPVAGVEHNMDSLVSIDRGDTIAYRPHWSEEIAVKEIEVIYALAVRCSGPVSVWVDEVDNYAPEGGSGNVIDRIIKEGPKAEVYGGLIAQDPADVRKKSLKHVDDYGFWYTGDFATDYLDSKGFPIEEIDRRIAQTPRCPEHNRPHGFCLMVAGELRGPYLLDGPCPV